MFKNASLEELKSLSQEDPAREETKTSAAEKGKELRSPAHAEEYRKMYADALRVLERIEL